MWSSLRYPEILSWVRYGRNNWADLQLSGFSIHSVRIDCSRFKIRIKLPREQLVHCSLLRNDSIPPVKQFQSSSSQTKFGSRDSNSSNNQHGALSQSKRCYRVRVRDFRRRSKTKPKSNLPIKKRATKRDNDICFESVSTKSVSTNPFQQISFYL